MVTYGYSVRYRAFGGTMTVSAEGCESRRQARYQAWQFAKQMGYTVPKWWQFWRWAEEREPRQHEWGEVINGPLEEGGQCVRCGTYATSGAETYCDA